VPPRSTGSAGLEGTSGLTVTWKLVEVQKDPVYSAMTASLMEETANPFRTRVACVTLDGVWSVVLTLESGTKESLVGGESALITQIVPVGTRETDVSVLMVSVPMRGGSVMMMMSVVGWTSVLAKSATVEEEPASGSATLLRTVEGIMMPFIANNLDTNAGVRGASASQSGWQKNVWSLSLAKMTRPPQ